MFLDVTYVTLLTLLPKIMILIVIVRFRLHKKLKAFSNKASLSILSLFVFQQQLFENINSHKGLIVRY